MSAQEKEIAKDLYVATVTTVGGRNGHSQSSDGLLDVALAFPKEIGGNGNATNPEQLFAAGLSACFGQTLAVLAGQQKLPLEIKNVRVTAHVHLLLKEVGYWLAADLEISTPGLEAAAAAALVEQAKQWCAYTNSTRGNVDFAYRLV